MNLGIDSFTDGESCTMVLHADKFSGHFVTAINGVFH